MMMLESQAPKSKFQTNPNDPNSKFQTHDLEEWRPGLTQLILFEIGFAYDEKQPG